MKKFERECDEKKGWINEKIKFDKDESYIDNKNLNGKVKKNKKFEKEMNEKKNRMEDIN
jgi:spectrin alpha